MLGIFEKIRRKFIHKDWILIESHTGVWNLNHGGGGLVQKFLFYNIEFCPQLNEYRLVTIGDRAEDHRIYGDMLSRLASFNTGKADDNFSMHSEAKPDEVDEVRIVSFPLTNDASDVWKLARDEKLLIEALDKHLPILKEDGIEVFERKFNMVATDVGYFAAVWLKDIDFSDVPPEDDKNETDEE